MGAFHAYDIRGIYNVDFDKDTAYRVGAFLPSLLGTDKVLVGRDCRVSSDEIHEYLLKGITDAGADVYDIGLSTTPMVYFGTAKYGFDASVQITASHNPKEYNGMSTLFAKEIFGDAPEYIFDDMDGTFPNHEPNPLVHKNVVALEELVKKTGADAGVIYDGDADRVMFVDETGKFVSPDLIIALLGHYFIDERGEKGIVIQDIRSSKAVGEYLEPMGAEMFTWKVGRANAARKLRELDGVWGGELAGHYYFRDFFYSDSGLLASILVLRVLASMKRKGISFSQLIGRIAGYENSGEINFRVEDKKGAMDAIRDHFTALQKPTAMMDFDGYRVEFSDWWFNIRPSNTEPYLRFICEATSAELLEKRIEEVKDILFTRFGATL